MSTAYAAPLVSSDDTCMGSSTAGAQGVSFGVSLGSTWQDDDCVRRKDARELHNMGMKVAALALMCQNTNVAKAMAMAGTPCPGGQKTLGKEVVNKASAATQVSENTSNSDVVYSYPKKRRN